MAHEEILVPRQFMWEDISGASSGESFKAAIPESSTGQYGKIYAQRADALKRK